MARDYTLNNGVKRRVKRLKDRHQIDINKNIYKKTKKAEKIGFFCAFLYRKMS